VLKIAGKYSLQVRPSYKNPDFSGFLEPHGIFRDLEGVLEILVKIFKVFSLSFTKKLETCKSFVTSDPEAFVCNVMMPPHSIGQRFYP